MLRQSVNPEIVQVYEAGCCESRAEDVGFFYLLGWEWVRFAIYRAATNLLLDHGAY
jgi:hypothetical protein